jgi:hypothetical protein
MRRFSKGPAKKLSPDSQRLVSFADAALQSASRMEERSWEDQLDLILQKLLKAGQQEPIDAALEHTFKTQPAVYDVLMEFTHEGAQWHGLLIAAPILAWTRYSIASGPINSDMLATLSAHFYAHLLAPDARMAMAPTLFSIDQLPQTHAATYALAQQLAQAALKGNPTRAPAQGA